VKKPERSPQGSILLLMAFLVAIAVTWGYTYWTLLRRE
jgi:hypothetical protein